MEDIDEVLARYNPNIVVKGKRESYFETFGTFDIETTSIEDRGFMYIWQFCIGDDVIIGRTWDEYLQMYDSIVKYFNINNANKFVIYVHFLGFEFQFIKDLHRWGKIFALEERSPIRADTVEGVQFRCSYKLSNMSLSKFCQNSDGCTHYKRDGEEFNYRIKRTCETKLTDKELVYCYCDVKGLHEALEYRLRDDTLATIPMTSTGYVRRKARSAMKTNPANREIFLDTQLDSYLYTFLRTGRRGGDAHASSIYADEILENVDSWDIKSSYPYVMMCKKFPMSAFLDFTPSMWETHVKYNACIMEVEFYNIKVKSPHHIPYIPRAKTLRIEGWIIDGKKKSWVNDNGRVMKASYVRMIITDIDLQIINDVYTYDGFNVIRGSCADYGMLPKEFREVIAEYFQLKCDLANGDPYYYGKIKNEVNALFGMMLTDICQPTIIYKNGVWDTDTGDIEKLLEKFYSSRNSFLPYQWGIWVTAHARQRLHEPMQYKNHAEQYRYGIYTDTDSWKMLQGYDRSIFEEINQKVIADAETYDVPPYAVDNKGNKIYLGLWEHEGTFETFKTLGSKKYAYVKDGKLHVTVSGLNKDGGAWYLEQLDGIESFTVGRRFPARHKYIEDGEKKERKVSGRTVSVYNDANKIFMDEYKGVKFMSASSIAIHDTTYTLGVTKEYDDLIKSIKKYGYSHLQ